MPREAMLFDTHCHLDAPQFDQDRESVIAQAQRVGVKALVIPAVEVSNFETVRVLAHSFSEGFYALGVHPLYVEHAPYCALEQLREALRQHHSDPRLIAIGEIGLDFFVADIAQGEPRAKQEFFFEAQLTLAREFDLPVLLHVRRSQDTILKYLRRQRVRGGIAHAFNGSDMQAQAFIGLGFALGFGGAVTFERATQLRRLALQLPLEALVLETDAPDIPPQWLYQTAQARADGAAQGRNAPAQLPRMAAMVAQLRGIAVADLAAATSANACRVVPRLGLPDSSRGQSSP
jgi:TatD DNase family protein